MAGTGKNLPVCPHCGSKRVKKMDEFYRCDDCKKDFGRTAISDDGEPLAEEVTGLRFRYGDEESGHTHLRIVQDEKECLFEVYRAMNGDVHKIADVMTLDEWSKLKKKLFQNVFLTDWDNTYIPVNDGQQIPEHVEWELGLEVNDTEERIYHGEGAYPVYWDKFLGYLMPYFKKPEKQ